MIHKGKLQYSGQEIANINAGQGGWFHSTPVANDIYVAKPNIFKNKIITEFRDGPAGDGSDTYVYANGHGFVNGDKVIISDSTNYDNSDQTLTISDVT